MAAGQNNLPRERSSSVLLRTLRRVPIFAAECLIRGYQVALSPLLIGHCKFCPSCSEYCIQAVREWGVIRGGWLALQRLLRCHPFSPGGIDPVPRRRTIGIEHDVSES